MYISLIHFKSLYTKKKEKRIKNKGACYYRRFPSRKCRKCENLEYCIRRAELEGREFPPTLKKILEEQL